MCASMWGRSTGGACLSRLRSEVIISTTWRLLRISARNSRSCSSGRDRTWGTGRLLEGIIESVDEYYSENLAQEVVRGMREAASRGFFLGSNAPFAYRKIKVSDGAKERPTLEVDPATAPVVRELFEKSLRGSGPQGAVQGAERPGHHQQRQALVQGNAPLRAAKRGVHRNRRLGQDQQGPGGRRSCKG